MNGEEIRTRVKMWNEKIVKESNNFLDSVNDGQGEFYFKYSQRFSSHKARPVCNGESQIEIFCKLQCFLEVKINGDLIGKTYQIEEQFVPVYAGEFPDQDSLTAKILINSATFDKFSEDYSIKSMWTDHGTWFPEDLREFFQRFRLYTDLNLSLACRTRPNERPRLKI